MYTRKSLETIVHVFFRTEKSGGYNTITTTFVAVMLSLYNCSEVIWHCSSTSVSSFPIFLPCLTSSVRQRADKRCDTGKNEDE